MDTQWPRWEVFKQDAPGRPHQAVGSVHAADAEHALLTARNVFARRPSAISIWVVRAEDVFAMTAEELEANPDWHVEAVLAQRAPERYLVFCKSSHRPSLTFVDHVGEVRASTPKEALRRAIEAFTEGPVFAWWVLPERRVSRSRGEDIESWFEPAKDKTYKQQSAYGMVRVEARRD